MIKKITYCKGLFPLLLYLGLSLSFIPSLILAEGADTSPTSIEETTHQTEPSSSNNEKNTPDFSADVKKGISTEAVWFGFDKEVTIAKRHETKISKAPSIVTVITDEEIKNLGYRTFVEILRTVPGFEILKKADFGEVVPAVRGLAGADKVRVMLNGHLVNNPLGGGAFGNFDDFPVENIKRSEERRVG